MSDTVLSRFVKDFGDYVLMAITTDLYSSDIVKVCVYVGGMLAFWHFALSLQKGIVSAKMIFFVLAWFSCLPIGGKPLAYILVNNAAVLLQSRLLKTAKQVLASKGSGGNLPPGYVINALIRAGNAKISDPALQGKVAHLIENCILDGVVNNQGSPLSAADLFITYGKTGQSGYSKSENFDPEVLKRAKSGMVNEANESVSCYGLLQNTRSALKKHMLGKRIATQQKDQGLALRGDGVSAVKASSPNSIAATFVKNTALNLASSISLQKEAFKKPGFGGVNEFFKNNTDGRVQSGVQESGSGLTQTMFKIMSLPTIIARDLKIDKAIDNASALHEMNEKMLSLPYMVAAVQNLLKVVAPLACLTLLFGTFKLFFAWSMMWVSTLLLPVVMTFSRGISNSLLYHANKIGEYADIAKGEPGFLKYGIDFDAANQMMADATRMMNNVLNVEMGVWSIVTMMLLASSWFTGNVANKVTASTSNMMSGIYGRKAIGSAENLTVKTAAATWKVVKNPIALKTNMVRGMNWVRGKNAGGSL